MFAKLLFMLSLILAIGQAFSQPIGGQISIKITHEDEEVSFRHSQKIGTDKLKSESREFVLRDLSQAHDQLYNFNYQMYPLKAIDGRGDYHIQVTKKKAHEVMDVFIYHIPSNVYYLEIPFKKGSYVLTILPDDQDQASVNHIKEIYQTKMEDNEPMGIDISPLDWNQHMLSKDDTVTLINPLDFLVQKKKEVVALKRLPESATYEGTVEYHQAKLTLDQDQVVLTNFYSPDLMDLYYTEMYGEIKHLSDSTYVMAIDSTIIVSASRNEELIEGHEPNTRLIDAGTLYCSNSLDSLLCRARVVENDTIPMSIGGDNFRNLEYVEMSSGKKYDISFEMYTWGEKVENKGPLYLVLNHTNRVTDEALKLPLIAMLTYNIDANKASYSRTITLKDSSMYIWEDRIHLKRSLTNE